ncbi:MAG: methionyl-tRNA formyltransferase [Desulfococcaceae bacterium]|jgi:methionyl-tRNA formyltransferase|nr:methionyl-tRNA formyltransferase [Desulfococcaceae bacterium]
MDKRFRIIFMGTPDFSVPCLQALHGRHDVLLVVTQPDRPKGRGRKLQAPPVKEKAAELGYEVIQPESVCTPAFAARMKAGEPDFFVVVAFGHILPQEVLEIPRMGAVNIHASLLPAYRGAAPIQRAVINGEKESGVTSMFMDRGMDTGDMLLWEKEEIRPDDTAGSLHDRLALKGADVLLRTLKEFEKGSAKPCPQDHSRATYAPMLKKADGRIDWNKSAAELDCFIRGMDPWPGAFTFCGDKRLRIYKGRAVTAENSEKPGTVLDAFPDELRIACGRDVLLIEEIQGKSGKKLHISDFLRGFPIAAGSILQ